LVVGKPLVDAAIDVKPFGLQISSCVPLLSKSDSSSVCVSQ
jgi:hypothetical protein